MNRLRAVLHGLWSMYAWQYPAVLVYMLQANEYHAGPYLSWYWHTQDFSHISYRGELRYTKVAKLLLLAVRFGIALELVAAATLIGLGQARGWSGGWQFGLALAVGYPVLWAHLVVLPLVMGREIIVRPRDRRLIRNAESIFATHPGIKIAIVGSYGKTSMKELLYTVLSAGKKVVATPANKNVAISHAAFARHLQGDEDVVIIEYGEGAPGDVARFAEVTHPTYAIITGIAPAHLDQYKTMEHVSEDIFSVAKYVKAQRVYVNIESPLAKAQLHKGQQTYSRSSVLGWKITNIRVGLDGTTFVMSKGAERLKLHSGLLGRHQVGPLALAAALAHELGLTPLQITTGVAATCPYQHRMQPYQLHGAWIVDDTYNGNIEGIRAGTALLTELPGKRKIYVTPGLVEQGPETITVHIEMGRLIAAAQPDIVVLMKNSVTQYIMQGLLEGAFGGELIQESQPLEFYANLQAFTAAGDVVLLQNDWPDQYH